MSSIEIIQQNDMCFTKYYKSLCLDIVYVKLMKKTYLLHNLKKEKGSNSAVSFL